MFAALARFSFRHRWPVLIFFILLFPTVGVMGGSAFSALKSGGFDDPTAESFKARQQLEERLQAGRADVIALYSVPSGRVEDAAVRQSVTDALARATADQAVERITSFYTTGSPAFVSTDGSRTFAVISLRGDDTEKERAADRLKPLLEASGATVQLGGIVPAGQAINVAVESGIQRAELIAFPITLVMLFVIFGSLVSAGVPLVMGVMAILLAFAALRVMALFTDVSIFAVNIVTVLGLGLAIDYSLFILNRYREELPTRGPEVALLTAISTTGRAVAFSGVTVAASLVGLFVFPQMFLRSMALGGIAVALMTVVISLTLLPALIAVLGTKLDAVRLPARFRRQTTSQTENGFWHRVAYAVMRRPLVVAVAVIALLLFLGSPFLRIQASIPDARVLSQQVEARQVSDTLAAEFLPNQSTPHEIALTARGEALTPQTIGAVYDYTQRVATIPGITRVESIFSIVPNLPRERYQLLYSTPAAQQDPGIAAGLAAYARGGVTRVAAVSAREFDASVTQAQVDALRDLTPPAGMDVQVGGAAADLTDLKASILERAPLMVGIIGVIMFVVLFLVFGSVTLPLKAMVMNLLSLTASFGAMVWIFQDGRFQDLLGYESLGSVNATQPILMFAIVFGLSMDYEVLLLSRVREEFVRTGDNTLAVARGLEKTGRLITSAAALLVVVFAAFATSDIVFMKELGVGVALAIALDATVVRGLLVPAAMRLMGNWNWWSPRPLARLWQRIGIGDLEGHAAPAASGD